MTKNNDHPIFDSTAVFDLDTATPMRPPKPPRLGATISLYIFSHCDLHKDLLSKLIETKKQIIFPLT